MELAAFIMRWVLAAVFAVAGLAKLADRAGSRQSIIEFGVPASLAAPGSLLLPLAELAVATALLIPVSARGGAGGALGLLALFIVGISANLARGRRPDCHCFGQLHSEPVGVKTLVRNALLSGLAVYVLAQGRGNARAITERFDHLTTFEQVLAVGGAILIVLALVEGWFLFNLFLQHGRLMLRLEAIEARSVPQQGLPVGDAAPEFRLRRLEGGSASLDSLLDPGRPLMLIFSDSQCSPCASLMPQVGRWQREHAERLTIAVLSNGSVDENRAAKEDGLRNVLLQEAGEVLEAYKALMTPSAVVVRPDRSIGSTTAGGSDAIGQLLTMLLEKDASAAREN